MNIPIKDVSLRISPSPIFQGWKMVQTITVQAKIFNLEKSFGVSARYQNSLAILKYDEKAEEIIYIDTDISTHTDILNKYTEHTYTQQ